MTPLEKAARALLDRAGYTEYGPVVPEGLAIELVRAVLLAVREPGKDALVAGAGAGPEVFWTHEAGPVFAAMIDAILKEETK